MKGSDGKFRGRYDWAGTEESANSLPYGFTPQAEKSHESGRRPPQMVRDHQLGGGDSFTRLHLQSDSHFGKWHRIDGC